MLKNYNPENERIIRKYFEYLKNALGLNIQTIRGERRALTEFQKYTRFASFKEFSQEQAIEFKNHILDRKLSKSTLSHYTSNLDRFFTWLKNEKGYQKKIDIRDIEYLRISRKDMNEIKSETYKPFHSFEDVQKAIRNMPFDTIIQRRNRALMSLILMTGARDKALSRIRIHNIDLSSNCLMQKGDTKNSKYIHTYFIMAVGNNIYKFFTEYYNELCQKLNFTDQDPLFPKTEMSNNEKSYDFEPTGLSKEFWANAEPIRKIFKETFHAVKLEYYPPHRIRKTLTQFAEQNCKTPEEFKAFSQNIGHKSVMTTLTSYGDISHHRQGELIKKLSHKSNSGEGNNDISDMKKMMAQFIAMQKK